MSCPSKQVKLDRSLEMIGRNQAIKADETKASSSPSESPLNKQTSP
jgi:hypothetical protein